MFLLHSGQLVPLFMGCREPSLPLEYIPELEAAANKAGLKWTDFQMTDNSCKPHPPAKTILEKVVPVVGAILVVFALWLSESPLNIVFGMAKQGGEEHPSCGLAGIHGRWPPLKMTLGVLPAYNHLKIMQDDD